MDTTITPMPVKFGVGFMTQQPIAPKMTEGYRHEQVGRYHNYHCTAANWNWPIFYDEHVGLRYVIDGFSPNLNKELHVGHLRQLALAKSLSRILISNAKFVALLGCTLGVKKSALDGWKYWTQFAQYNPTVYYDVVLPVDVIQTREPTVKEIEEKIINVNEGGDFDLPQLWDGPLGPVVVTRSDGRPLYAFYDLVFAKEIGPTHYITGHEQQEHFAKLGLADKHLPMGLILGTDGTKLKSRTGDALSAVEATELVCSNIRNASDTVQQVAWNILCWNFLHAAREKNLKFEVEKWTTPDAPGMYITYTYARVKKALAPHYPQHMHNSYNKAVAVEDVKLLGLSEQYHYYRHRAIHGMDPAPIANFAHDLARALGAAYEHEPIRNGRESFVHAVCHALWRLESCMTDLGMFLVSEV